ncbi:hypothetical protein WN944_001387 [Citrus x changshan-huyou]|uniref:Secreted protein n=1 Tax=Citrus x changshan-huyou TaxID=2935761 RepID=A0AAP0MEL9_9ROSI
MPHHRSMPRHRSVNVNSVVNMLVLLLIVAADGDHHTVDCCLETPSVAALTVLLGHVVVDGPSEACGEGVDEGRL